MKRCLESKILSSDKFLSLPITTRLLYIYLNLEADNRGFLASAQGTIKKIGASQEDLENLIINEYLIKLPNDVYCITHWFIHNKEDRRLSSDFQESELVDLRNKQYILRDDNFKNDGYNFLPSNGI